MKTPPLLICAFLLASTSSFAAPGDVDSSFGTDDGGPNTNTNAVAISPDGKINIGGIFTSITDGAGTFAKNGIARLESDGSVQQDFVGSGFGVSGGAATVNCVVVQPDGKTIIAGDFTSVSDASGTYSRNRIARLRVDGSIDTSFAPVGTGPSSGSIVCIALQPNGKVIIGGEFFEIHESATINYRTRIARLDADGTFDDTFGASQKGVAGTVYALALQSDGKVLVGGAFTQVSDATNVYQRKRIARLEADGSLDLNFGSGTIGAEGTVECIIAQLDGKIFLTGFFTGYTDATGTHFRNRVARINGDGSFDDSFGSSTAGPNLGVIDAVLQADGKYIICGNFATVSDDQLLHTRADYARLKADGSVDTTFGSANSGTAGAVNGLAIQADGKVIAVGTYLTISDGIIYNRKRVARLLNDPATSALSAGSNRIEWLRGGSAPEANRVTFESSTDGGSTWVPLGGGTSISGGWELTGQNLGAGDQVRARAYVISGGTGSSGIVEAIANVPVPGGGSGGSAGSGSSGGAGSNGSGGGGSPDSRSPADTWSQYYSLADDSYNTYASAGSYAYGLAFYSLYYGLGDFEFHNAYDRPGEANLGYYGGLANYFLYLYSASGENATANFYAYYYYAFAYYFYFLAYGDTTSANYYYNAFIALAFG